MENDHCILCYLKSGCPQDHSLALHEQLKSKIHSFRKGHILFHQDLPNKDIYYIMNGVVKIYSITDGGKQIIHALLPAGDIAGMSALPENKLSPYTAEVIEDARLCLLERNDVLELFRTQPAFVELILGKITKAQEDAYHRNDHLINFKVRERMARCLLELGKCFGEEDANRIRIKLRLNREDLASVIGVAPETAIRFLSEFKREHLITEDDRQIVIMNVKALQETYEKESRDHTTENINLTNIQRLQ